MKRLLILLAVALLALQPAWSAVDFCAGLANKSGPVIYPAHMPYDYLNTTWETLYSFCEQLPKLEADTLFFNWGPFPDCIRWGIQGRIEESEMDFLTSPERGDLNVAGNGFYVAKNNQSSERYGPCATYALIPTGTPILDFKLAAHQFHFLSIYDMKKVYLGRLVPFIHYYNVQYDWWVTHHHLPLQDLSSGPQNGTRDSQRRAFQWNLLDSDQKLKFFYGTLSDSAWLSSLWGMRASLFRDSLEYFQNFAALLIYQDPISVMRTAIVNPKNPWAEFELQNFEAYKTFFYDLANNIVQAWPSTYLGISDPSKGRFGVGIVDDWVDKMINSIIPQIYGMQDSSWREDMVRAGGDQAAVVTGAQLEALQSNPYLYVEASPVPNQNDTFYVSYYYPDAHESDHWTKIMNKSGILSQTMIDELQGCCGDNNTQLLMHALSSFAVRAMYGKPVGGAIPLVVTLASIHPYVNYNDRGLRLLAWLSALEAKQPLPFSFIPDFTLLLGSDYPEFVSFAENLYMDLMQAMFSKMIRTVMYENRMAEAADYYKLPEWSGMWNALRYFNKDFRSPKSLTQIQLDQSRRHDWVPLLDSLFGSLAWRKQPSPSFDWKKH